MYSVHKAKNAKGNRKHSPLNLGWEWLKLPLSSFQYSWPVHGDLLLVSVSQLSRSTPLIQPNHFNRSNPHFTAFTLAFLQAVCALVEHELDELDVF